jgi:hypothetical protein
MAHNSMYMNLSLTYPRSPCASVTNSVYLSGKFIFYSLRPSRFSASALDLFKVLLRDRIIFV